MSLHPIACRIVDSLHVSVSNRDVIRAVRSKFRRKYRRAASHRDARKGVYRQAIVRHCENRALFAAVMAGAI